jgi:hypothetical protein
MRTQLLRVALALTPALVLSSCLARDVATGTPDQKSSFVALVRAGGLDKVDLVFAIDNSASMGDKQELLRQAIPDLIERLVRPRCVDRAGNVVGAYDPKLACPAGSDPEIQPIRDLHVGIVSSSLGGLGAPACAGPTDNDHAHLVVRTKSGGPEVTAAAPGGFLAYLPDVPENAGRPRDAATVGVPPLEDPKALVESFQKLVVGVGETGCGYEAQLESVYRFLIEPAPYAQVLRDGVTARLDGIDTTLLKQRSQFLRPDSLVAVVMVTDENESTVDPLAISGQAWRLLDDAPMAPGTTACRDDPDSPDCTSCWSPHGPDPRCTSEPTLVGDDVNLRFWDMKRRFGIDPRYPLERYVRGFTNDEVTDQTGTRTCSNPLFAAVLPAGTGELCKLERGGRTMDDFIFAVIAGVPWQLLTEAPQDLSRGNKAPFKEALTPADWMMLLGPGTKTRRFDQAHPLLRESIDPREGVSPNGDGAHDREWNTRGRELQYTCTFELETPRDCSPNDARCDCGESTDSPLCDPTNPHRQLRGKAYPALSTLAVARDLGERAVVSSICPREARDKTSADYGYRPAMRTLYQSIRDNLVGSCVPKLHPDIEGHVPCLVLEAQPKEVTTCDASRGRRPADPDTLRRLREDSGTGLDNRTVCAVDQIEPSQRRDALCADAPVPGFCYVTGAEAPRSCEQAVAFSKLGAPIPNSRVYLQCIDARTNEL